MTAKLLKLLKKTLAIATVAIKTVAITTVAIKTVAITTVPIVTEAINLPNFLIRTSLLSSSGFVRSIPESYTRVEGKPQVKICEWFMNCI